MDPEVAEAAIKAFMTEILDRLSLAAGAAKAARACADTDNVAKAVEIEQPMYETNTLLNAVSLISRIVG
jgi:hypothetical protein